jgi:carboxymethylenebutenolidase
VLKQESLPPSPEHEFLVHPKGATGCVVVIHEVWGLVGHTKDVCKRVGKLGFAAVAPNLYRGHSELLTPDNIQKAMEGVWELSLEERRDKTKVSEALDKQGASGDVRKVVSIIYDQAFRDRLLEDALASVERARSKFPDVATLGYCIGGALSLKCATKSRTLRSAISYYGQPPPTADVSKISIPILAIHANHDEIINKSVPEFVGAMLDGGKDLTLKTFPRTKHGFFNDSRKEVYDRRSAEAAWEVTRWFLEKTLARN